jgi:hypothetical protein
MARNFLFLKGSKNDETRQNNLEQGLERCVSWCLQSDLTNTDQFGADPASFWAEVMAHEIPIDFKNDKQDETTIWIAFDEARSLLVEYGGRISDFRILRRALKEVSKRVGNCMFVILADTKSSIANFPPSKKIDASARPDAPKLDGTNLFHPYVLLLTHDALKDSRVDFRDEWSFVNCGRPLWKSLYQNPSESSPEMLKYAADKLRGSQSADEDVVDELADLAIVLCRTGVYVSPQTSTASNLAANYMATLLLSDCTHEHFLVTYLSDPVLAIASARLWYQKDFLVRRGLPVLRQTLVHGAVVQGYLGELVGRFLLLLGMDKASKEGYYDGKWYKVSEFMKHCFGITLSAMSMHRQLINT